LEYSFGVLVVHRNAGVPPAFFALESAVTTLRQKTAAELLGVREIARNARDRLLDRAIDLFYTYGFHAVGLDRIIDETGVTKTTFYKHFESKDDLLIAAVEKRHEWERAAWSSAIIKKAGTDPRAQLLAMFDLLDEWFNAPDYGGCIFISAAVEFVDPNDPVHKAASRHKTQNREDTLQTARAAGLEDPVSFTDFYITIFEGALIMRHVHHRNDAARVARPMIERLIEQHTSKRKPKRKSVT
jgi:AcrR family transcriptional regulator